MNGQRLRDNEEPVNFSLERELIFRLYSGKNTARYQNVALCERCICRMRIGVFQLTIDDWVHLFKNEWIEIGQEDIERFKRTYQHLRDESPFFW